MTKSTNTELNLDCKYFFLPVQLIEHDNAVILRRGVTQIKIQGDESHQIVNTMIILASEDGATIEEMVNYFGQPNADMIMYLVKELIEKRILVEKEVKDELSASSSASVAFDNFRWALGLDATATRKIEDTQLRILGINHISHKLCTLLQQTGFQQIVIIDYLPFRDLSFFDEAGRLDHNKWNIDPKITVSYQDWMDNIEMETFNCLITTSGFGGMYAMRPFNKFCVENNLTFLPIAVQNLKAFIGPIVIPGFTACFECLLQRQNSKMNDFEVKRVIELSDYEGQSVGVFHPSMHAIAADIAALELYKFYSGMTDLQNVGRTIEVNLLNLDLRNKQVLKVPRCPVCSGIHSISNTSVSENEFMPTHYE